MSEKAPWETDSDESAPWAGTENELPESIMLGLKEEMHPEFTTLERVVPKNLSNDPEATIAYLKERHPDLDIKHINGRIVAKGKDETEYRALDPDSGFDPFSVEGLKEAGRDALDVGYDALSGLAQGAATTASGVAGGLATAPSGGLGALPAAMAGGAATSAGLEALRQKLGAMAGLPQEVSGKDVGQAALLGGVSPLVFGAGATKAALGAAAAKAGKELTPEMIAGVLRSGRGLTGRAKDVASRTVLPLWGQMASGVHRNTTRSLQDYLPKIKGLEVSGALEDAYATHNDITSTLKAEQARLGKLVGESTKSATDSVDLTKIRKPIEDALGEYRLQAEKYDSPTNLKSLETLQKIYDDLFTRGTSSDAEKKFVVAGMGEPLKKSGTKELQPDRIPADVALKLQRNLADLAAFGDIPKKGTGILSRLVDKSADEQDAARAAQEAYHAVNKEMERVTQGASKEAKDAYKKHVQIERDLQPFFKTPEKTFDTLSTVTKKNNRLLNEKLRNLEEDYGIPVTEKARIYEALRLYSDPALNGLSSLGVTSTSRSVPLAGFLGTIGSLMGYKSGGGYAGAAGGGIGGTMLGNYLGSPHMTRNLVEIDAKSAALNEAAKAYGVPVGYGVGRSAWQGLKGQDE